MMSDTMLLVGQITTKNALTKALFADISKLCIRTAMLAALYFAWCDYNTTIYFLINVFVITDYNTTSYFLINVT